ncbi:uncharacterized protein LOC135349939 [Halichondria panicea]|uniref:uncharacterized protein LOC135349939 n=1 Tax=Halichondria panicea TaxID=6063 RepID=UPI00312BC1EB
MPGLSIGTCKRWSTYITMAMFFLTGGIEYSVIFPTMYNYVQELGGEEWLYGLSLSAFSISNLITSPLYGIIFDKTKQTKWIVLVGNLFEIGGNFMYFAAYTVGSPYLILASRFVVGAGAGAGAAIFAELALTTSKKQRTTIYSLFLALRQLGMVVGPAFNLFLEEANFKVGPFPVNRLSFPGVFMAIVWIIVEILFLFFCFRLPHVEQDGETQNSKSVEAHTSNHNTAVTQSTNGDTTVSEDEVAPLLHTKTLSSCINGVAYGSTSPTQRMSSPTINHSVSVDTYILVKPAVREEKGCSALVGRFRKYCMYLLSEMVREEIIVLLALLFVTMFNQATIETMFVPMAEDLLNWNEKEISFFYSGAGFEIILAFVLVSLLSRLLGDRWLLLIGLIFDIVGWGWLLGLVGNATSETPWVMWRFMIGGVIVLWGLPFALVTGASLYSKILPADIQGFGQGFRRSCFSVGAILGALWAGGAGSFGSTYYVLLGVPAALYVLMLFMVLVTFVRLKEAPSKKNQPPSVDTMKTDKSSHKQNKAS